MTNRPPLPDYASGPYESLDRANEIAHDQVSPAEPMWAVVELYGEGYNTLGGEYGTLYVTPEDKADELAEHMGAESHSVVEGWGYSREQMIEVINPIVDKFNAGVPITEDDSATVKSFFDHYHPETTDEGRKVASAFTAETDEWAAEVREGRR